MKIDYKKYDFIVVIFWIGFGIFIMFLSYRLGLGEFGSPGPGLFPFLAALFILLIAISQALLFFCKGGRDEVPLREEQGETNFGNLLLVLAPLFAYGLLLKTLGFLITTILFLFLLFWYMGSKRWSAALIASILIVAITYCIFTYLGITFPKGILKDIL